MRRFRFHGNAQGLTVSNDPNASPAPQDASGLSLGKSRGARREIVAWAMYDWANSAYSALSITVVMIYLKAVVFPEAVWGNLSGAVYPAALSVSMLTAAVLSPIVGAMADARATKRWWLAGTALSGALCAVVMGLTPVAYPWLVLFLFALTSFFFELSYGFYNAFLPEIAVEETMDKVSAWGFGAGYVGGGVALGLQLLVFSLGDQIGLNDDTTKLRVGLVLMGCWWGVFTLPAIIVLRDKATPRQAKTSILRAANQAVREVGTTLGNIRGYRMLALFLLGFLFYNDCVQTVITQASQLGEELGFEAAELVLVILMIQFMALPGALAIGFLSRRVGQKPMLHFCLAVWAVLLAAGWFIDAKWQFWVLGGVVAIVMGGVQSVSRAIMGTMTPAARTGEFFGFFNLSSKATAFIGTATFALVMLLTNDARIALLSLSIQLIAGWAIVSRVNVAEGRAEALATSSRQGS
jgi:UMF1 family MFS transporter